MRVAVLKGGRSLEREVSLRSGTNVEAALRRLGHEAIPVDVDQQLIRRLKAERPDVAFIAMHGRGGEDGTVQELLEIAGVPYTGSGVSASARAMDKVVAKGLMRATGVPTPEFNTFSRSAFQEMGAADLLPDIVEQLGLPVVVKPSKQGSALGVKVAQTIAELPRALVAALSYDDRVVVERLVPGRDLAVSVLGTGDEAWALPVVEAIPQARQFFDFESRYTPGMTRLVCPADLPDPIAQEAARLALLAYRSLNCRGFGRVDMMLADDGGLWVLEVDTVPGMTDSSLLPMAAEAAGLGFDEVVARVLEGAALG